MMTMLTVRPAEGHEPLYEVVLSTNNGCTEEEAIRDVVQRSRGELKRLGHTTRQHHARLHLHLGRRRIDDVVTALEGAGFTIDAVIATPPERGGRRFIDPR
jgi:hypothetical protein